MWVYGQVHLSWLMRMKLTQHNGMTPTCNIQCDMSGPARWTDLFNSIWLRAMGKHSKCDLDLFPQVIFMSYSQWLRLMDILAICAKSHLQPTLIMLLLDEASKWGCPKLHFEWMSVSDQRSIAFSAPDFTSLSCFTSHTQLYASCVTWK